MPTTWAKRVATAGGFQEGRSSGSGVGDYFIDVLFEGTGFMGIVPTPMTERSAPATATTERSSVFTPWTERVA